MYYYKCSNCGHFNPVTSEYLIFCGNCGKKLQINFRDWHNQNPDKNLNDFHTLFCTQNITKPITSKTRTVNLPKKIIFLCLFPVAILLLFLENEFLPFVLNNRVLANEMIAQNWSAKQLGKISLETPFEFINKSDQLNYETVETLNTYAYISNTGFEILVNSIVYKEEIAEKNLVSISLDPIKEMQLNTSISKLDYKKSYSSVSMFGAIYEGSFFLSKSEFQFIISTYAEKYTLHQIIIVFSSDQKLDKFVAYRILCSLNIKS